MPVVIRTMDRILASWVRQSATATPAYEAGIKAPRRDWMEACGSSEAIYVAAMQASIARNAWVKGALRAGTTAWTNGALTKGVQRWAQGIALSQDKFRKGFEPYRELIAGLTLPTRGPKGDPANIERVRFICDALHQKKVRP